MARNAPNPRTIIILTPEDIQNPLHPTMWTDICEQLGYTPNEYGEWPTELQIATRGAEAHY